MDVVTYSLCKKYANQLAAAGIQSVSYDSTNSQIVVVYGTNPPTTIRYTIPTIKGDPGEDGVGISSAAVTADYHLKLVYTDGTEWTSTESIRGPQGEQGLPGPTYTAGEGISISNNVISCTARSLKPMKSAWKTGTTAAAATAILNDADVLEGDGFLATVYWSDLPGDVSQSEVKAFVLKKDGSYQKIIQFECTSSDASPYAWFYNSYAGVWRSYVPINSTLEGTSDTQALASSVGATLSGRIDNLQNMGRFLSIWNCTTGLPTSNPTPTPTVQNPYEYKVGDYYRVGTVSDGGTNYKPNGASYNCTASTTVEEETVAIGSVYYYDGTNWLQQAAGAGGTVKNVKVNNVSVLDEPTGIASIPATSLQAFGAIKAGTMSAAEYAALTTKDPDAYYFIEY